MPKLSDFDVSFDPQKDEEEKKRGIEFWHKYITLIRPLQQKRALNLKEPKKGILDFLKTKKHEPFSVEWEPFEKDGSNINPSIFANLKANSNDTIIGKLQRINFSSNNIDRIIDVFKIINGINTEKIYQATRNSFINNQKLKASASVVVDTSSSDSNATSTSSTRPSSIIEALNKELERETLKGKDENDEIQKKEDPNFRAVDNQDNNLERDKETKKPLSIRNFANVGDLRIDPEKCVADWKINGSYEHEFRRCKPHAEIEYDKEGQYGWKTPEPFVERFRQDTVFGVPVVFSQNMVFEQQIENKDEILILNCALFICSKVFSKQNKFRYNGVTYFDENHLDIKISFKNSLYFEIGGTELQTG